MKRMQKFGYTLAETLIALGIVGVLAALMLPMINKIKPDTTNISYLKVYDVINEAITMVQPPSDKGRRLKIYYATQAATRPPTFVVFCNSAKLFHFSYQRYIENQIRKNFGGLEGTPVRIIVREKTKEDK